VNAQNVLQDYSYKGKHVFHSVLLTYTFQIPKTIYAIYVQYLVDLAQVMLITVLHVFKTFNTDFFTKTNAINFVQ